MPNNSISVNNRYAQINHAIQDKIATEPDNFIIGSSAETLVDYYFSNNHFLPLEIDGLRSETVTIDKRWKTIPAERRERGYQHEGDLSVHFETLFLHIPIKPNMHIEQIKSLNISTYTTGYSVSDIIWEKDQLTLQIPVKGYGINNDDDRVKQLLENTRKWLYNRLEYLKMEIESNNIQLLGNITQWIGERKTKIENDDQRYASLLKKIDIPLKKREDEAVKRIQLDQKPIIQKIRPTPAAPEDYQIDRQKVIDIISVLDNQGRQFEKTPGSYVSLGEQALRDVLLTNLNSIFEGKATGETFSNKGKSDIYLNIDKGCILVFECKIWDGRKNYHETIEQLLGYLTWRHNYGIIIFFSRNKGFTNILSEGQSAIESHSSYKNGFHKLNASHFISQHRFPSDDQKQVEIHHLFYNLFF